MIIDRLRVAVIEMNTNRILTRDLIVKEPEVEVNLSGPSIISFKVDQGQRFESAAGINFKSWGQWIISEITTDQFGGICMGAQMLTKAIPDPKTGDLQIEGQGFLGYPKDLPWLENYNPIAVDPAEVIQRIWAHIQSYVNANLGVDVQPASTGTQMLPGFGFDGNILNFDFWALFIRAVDFQDCGDQIMQLARDLPLDLFEDVSWNADRTEVNKTCRIAYPYGGVRQDNLAFRLGENVIDAELADELEIEPVSDVIIRSWIPGRTYSSILTNADMTRARRTIMEEAVNISNTERAAAWAKRKLTRRNIPTSFQKITIDPNHPNAPFGSWWIGDSIFIQARDYPWHGQVEEWHRITSIKYKDGQPTMELGVKAEGAWNYDPIDYDPNALNEPTVDPNLLPNGYFTGNLAGWYAIRGQWIRLATVGYSGDGCVRIDCDDGGEELQSARITVNPGETLNVEAAVRYQSIALAGTADWAFAVGVNTHYFGGDVQRGIIVDGIVHDGTGPFTRLTGQFTVPNDMTVNEISVSLLVNPIAVGGNCLWDDVRVTRPSV